MLTSIILGCVAIYCGYLFFGLFSLKDRSFNGFAISCGIMAIVFMTAAFGDYRLLGIFSVIGAVVVVVMLATMAVINHEEATKKTSR